MQRRVFLLAAAVTAASAAKLVQAGTNETPISAKKFEFHPAEVHLKLGQPAILVLTSEDRIHGFKVPDLGLRAEIVPGQETRLALTPDKAGRIVFLCDVFCGDGHEEMEGILIVEA
ncbi:cupredoxin domain-containing protein [Reyranella sp.]|uniref:cupredoxin domain-containing protein n=1 Tax=Reyranella sp. TaxID=1929291 RepID=UPI0025D39BE9|nr:cupredoxin domain-containing protein [Reyranella sp.]